MTSDSNDVEVYASFHVWLKYGVTQIIPRVLLLYMCSYTIGYRGFFANCHNVYLIKINILYTICTNVYYSNILLIFRFHHLSGQKIWKFVINILYYTINIDLLYNYMIININLHFRFRNEEKKSESSRIVWKMKTKKLHYYYNYYCYYYYHEMHLNLLLD